MMPLSSFTPPDKARMTTRLGGRLEALEAARVGLVARRRQSSDNCLRRNTHEYWMELSRDLRHPLSEKWRQNQDIRAPRSPRDLTEEVDLAEQARRRLGKVDSLKFDQFFHWICSVNMLTGASGAGELRTINVQSSADRLGRRIAFSPPDDLRRQLSLLSEASREWEHNQSFRASLMLLGIIAIHPFADGNGRTARACFNALLFNERPAPFVPIRMIMDCSCGGFEIRMRHAIFNGSWGEIITYLTAALDYS